MLSVSNFVSGITSYKITILEVEVEAVEAAEKSITSKILMRRRSDMKATRSDLLLLRVIWSLMGVIQRPLGVIQSHWE